MIDGRCRPRKVGGMQYSGWRTISFAGVLCVAACGRSDSVPRVDSIPLATDTVRMAPATRAPWVGELGEAWVVPADSEGTAMVVFPGAPSERLLSSRALTLITAAGDSTIARAVLVASDSQVCGEAPMVRFTDTVAVPWSVGFIGSRASAIRMDSLAALPSADSLRLAGELARLASSIPMDPASRFKGLPFVVLGARQLDIREHPAIVTRLVRRLPQESAPLEEHTLLVAEADTAAGGSRRWRLAYYQRSEGSEETAEQYEVLAAFQAPAGTLLLIARHRDTQSIYEVLERSAAGAWRSRWLRILSC